MEIKLVLFDDIYSTSKPLGIFCVSKCQYQYQCAFDVMDIAIFICVGLSNQTHLLSHRHSLYFSHSFFLFFFFSFVLSKFICIPRILLKISNTICRRTIKSIGIAHAFCFTLITFRFYLDEVVRNKCRKFTTLLKRAYFVALV